ncbi:MAG: diadenylate cyclase CdaA [Oscillospiraceae bacterium]|nr:diadenylate cyclase CdaA [Oscillospiraceae bacterium]
MNTFLTDLVDSAKYILSMQWYDVVDILLVAGAIYAVLTFIRRTNATKVAQGILILIIALWLSSALGLTVTNFILQQVFSIGIIAVVVLFQPEIRRALERVGSNPMFSFLGRDWGSQALENVIMQTVYACEDMAKSRTGALIVFERYNRLDEQLSSGTAMDAIVSTELLKNIFFDKSPLHDGAVIVKDGRIAAAGCMLPLSKNANLSRDLGMRHRAGIGMSEHSDAVVVIVSEETGGISVAVDGLLKRHLSPDTFEMLLRRELLPADEPDKRITLRDKLRRKMEKKHGENEGDK